MRSIVVIASVFLIGCTSSSPPKSFAVAVVADCIPKGLPDLPSYTVTPAQMRSAPDAAERMRLAYKFWTAVQPWLAPATAAIDGCRAAAIKSSP